MNAWLENSSGARIPLQGTLSIGRAPENTLILKGEGASRRHALIHPQGGGEHWLVDLGSRNGTQHQGRRLCQPVRLTDQDVLVIGDYPLVYHRRDGSGGEAGMSGCRRESCQVRTWMLKAEIRNAGELLQSNTTDRAAYLVGRWFLACKDAIEQNRGTLSFYQPGGFFAFWSDPGVRCATVARVMSDLETLQGDRAPAFRVIVHYGAITVTRSATSGEERLEGLEVDFANRLQILAGTLGKEWLISEPAGIRLTDHLALSHAGRHAVPDTRGTSAFYTF